MMQAMRETVPKMAPPPDVRPKAHATVEPLGPRARKPRGHAVRLYVELNGFDAQFADRARVLTFIHEALHELADGEPARCFDVRGAKEKLVGIEAAVICADTPAEGALGRLRDALTAAGYTATIRELRECDDESCTTTAPMDSGQTGSTPVGWYNAQTCGKHGYRACAGCNSVYVMSSANASGQAASIHCEVCGMVLVEWGGTKVWTVELVTRGNPTGA